jgi:hypothetical protein
MDNSDLLTAVILVGLYFLLLVPAKTVKAPVIATGLVVSNIKANDEISSPAKINGYANRRRLGRV